MDTKVSAHEHIKRMIFAGELKPGEPVRERAIAERLGTSRLPVREAFQRLTLEGILITVPGKGLVVRTYSDSDLLDLYLYRECLEGMAARLFATRAERMEIEYLRMVFSEMETTATRYDRDYWIEKDLEFHRLIARGTRNERIGRALENLYDESLCLRVISGDPHRTAEGAGAPPHLPGVVEEHRAILNAIESGDADAAEETARRSIKAGVSRHLRLLIERSRRGGPEGEPEGSGAGATGAVQGGALNERG